MSLDKRKQPPDALSSHLVKRQKATTDLTLAQSSTDALIPSIARTSNLSVPIIQLLGHTGDIFACRFNSNGSHLASAGHDRSILLWTTYGDNENYGVINGHKGSILDLQWSRDSRVLYTAATDNTLGMWDAFTGQRIRKHVGHEDVVNSLDVLKRGAEILASGSDDGSIAIWDTRQKTCIDYYQEGYPVTAVCFSEAGNQIFSGGLDNNVKVWDIRKKAVSLTLSGHSDTITSLALSPDGSSLLSNSMDNTLRLWDVKPFAAGDRLLKSYEGAPHGFERNLIKANWSFDGRYIMAGSADKTLTIWSVESGQIMYKLPGHKGIVNDCGFHPLEPIIMSASTDRSIILGEI